MRYKKAIVIFAVGIDKIAFLGVICAKTQHELAKDAALASN